MAAGLKQLQATGFALACITNKPRQFVEPILEGLGIAERFRAVVCGDDVARKKPHPEALITACERLGVDLQQYEPLLVASDFGQAVDCLIDGNR